MPTTEQALLRHERTVLGALLRSNDPSISAAVADLQAEAFAVPAHQAIYWRLLIDHVEPDADPDLDAALGVMGGTEHLDELEDAGRSVAGPKRVAAAAGVIQRRWVERQATELRP